ncbi:MAG: hypothetical protein HYS21_12350 [Deltaproteobacteria bacterium]|nr:hypothetical protein [Deltaproteobacteria bacterium]
MKKKASVFLAIPVLLAALSGSAFSGELVYNFVSPSFGGSPINGQWLMSYMSAQNDFTAKPGDSMQNLGEALRNVKDATINIQSGENQTSVTVNQQNP